MQVLLIRFSSLGDVVLATAVIEALARTVPGVEIDLAVKEEFAGLFRNDPRVRHVFPWEKGQGFFAYVRRLRRQKYDWVFDLHRVLRSFLLYPFIRRAHWVGCRKRSLQRRLFVRFRIRREGWIRPLLDAYLEVLARSGFGKERVLPRLVPPGDAVRAARQMLDSFGFKGERPILALAPGARQDIRRWAGERFAEVGKRAAAELGAQVLVIGTLGEQELVARVTAECGAAGARPVTGLPLDQLSALLAQVDLLIGNDSGPAHVARAVGTPAGVVYGPTSSEIFPPLGPHDFGVEKEMSCRPCGLRGERPCSRGRRACLDDIPAEEVFTEVEKVISLRRQRQGGTFA